MELIIGNVFNNMKYNKVFSALTPKVLGVFFIKTASKQPLFKAR
jgi:hypothetical protein